MQSLKLWDPFGSGNLGSRGSPSAGTAGIEEKEKDFFWDQLFTPPAVPWVCPGLKPPSRGILFVQEIWDQGAVPGGFWGALHSPEQSTRS